MTKSFSDTTHRRKIYGLSWWPPGTNTSRDRVRIDAGNVRPSPCGLQYSVDLNVAAIAFVFALFSDGAPLAVTWLVITVYVNTLQGILFRRARPKTFVESLETFRATPFCTDRYSATAIEFPAARRRQQATIFHACPYLILVAARHAVSYGVRSLVATTRNYGFGSQVASSRCAFISTGAYAAPNYGALPCGAEALDCRQSPKALAAEVFAPFHVNDWFQASKKARIDYRHWLLLGKSLFRGFRVFPHPVASFYCAIIA